MDWKKARVLMAAICLVWALPLLAQDDTLDWLNNYKEALQEARQTNKPIFLEFRCEA